MQKKANRNEKNNSFSLSLLFVFVFLVKLLSIRELADNDGRISWLLFLTLSFLSIHNYPSDHTTLLLLVFFSAFSLILLFTFRKTNAKSSYF